MKDLLDKQQSERRKTKDFLRFALGKRQAFESEKVEKLRSLKYNPLADPLVPKLFRKYNHALSINSSHVSI